MTNVCSPGIIQTKGFSVTGSAVVELPGLQWQDQPRHDRRVSLWQELPCLTETRCCTVSSPVLFNKWKAAGFAVTQPWSAVWILDLQSGQLGPPGTRVKTLTAPLWQQWAPSLCLSFLLCFFFHSFFSSMFILGHCAKPLTCSRVQQLYLLCLRRCQ